MDEVELPAKDTQTRALPPEYSDPERYRVLSNGAIYDMQTKRIAANPGGGTTAITHASASHLHTLWAAKKRRAQLRGLVRGTDIDPSDIPDELLAQAESAAEVVVAHTVKTYLASKNIRGMAEVLNKILMLDDDSGGQAQDNPAAKAVTDLAAAIRAIAEGQQQRDIVDGKVTDAD